MVDTERLLDILRGTSPEHRASRIGQRCWNREGTEAGTITATSICQLGGCGGTRLHVKWPDGRRTRPCAKGCVQDSNGDWRIL